MSTPERSPANKPQYARAKEAAAHFRIGRSTLYEWLSRPGFPQPFKASQRVTLFDLNAIDAYLKAQQGKS